MTRYSKRDKNGLKNNNKKQAKSGETALLPTRYPVTAWARGGEHMSNERRELEELFLSTGGIPSARAAINTLSNARARAHTDTTSRRSRIHTHGTERTAHVLKTEMQTNFKIKAGRVEAFNYEGYQVTGVFGSSSVYFLSAALELI